MKLFLNNAIPAKRRKKQKMKTKSAINIALLMTVLIITELPITQQTKAATSDGSTFSIVQISDTQRLAFLSPTLYNDITSWIVNNSATNNVKMVIDTGDFIDAIGVAPNGTITIYNTTVKGQEWAIANASIGKLLDAGIPYCWDAGNHDQSPFGSPNGTGLTSGGAGFLAFNTTYLRSKPYWLSDLYNSKNTAVKFNANNYPFIIINLEYLANSSTLAWMKNILDTNPTTNIIVATHAYLDNNANLDTYYNGAFDDSVGNWTQNLRKTLNNYPNIILALSGHNSGWNMTRTGNREEILFNRQDENNMTGSAAVRIYTFNTNTMTVAASTYCIDTKTWLTDPYNQFTFNTALTSSPISNTLDATAFQSVTVSPGWTWWFFTQTKGGITPYTYQWYEGSTPIQGQTDAVLAVTKNTPGTYRFYCRVTSKDGSTTTSNNVTLTVTS